MAKNEVSPMMQHYLELKEQYSDCVLFYRLGDFYELFDEDAKEISKVLELTLTSKSSGSLGKVPMCGVPFHSADTYIAKLVSLGYKVAICEQLTEPVKGQIVERDVIRVITAGTLTDESMLDEKQNNYIMCLCHDEKKLCITYCDITTGLVHVQTITTALDSTFTDIYERVKPSQIIGNSSAKVFYENLPIQKFTSCPKFEQFYEYAFMFDKAKENVCLQFGDNAISVFELNDKCEVECVGALLEYLKETQKRSIKNINKIIRHKNNDYMIIDANTRRNLELVEGIRERKKFGSLLWLLDKTKTGMGARKLRRAFDEPYNDSAKINQRLDAVEELTKNLIVRDRLRECLSNIYDIERISGKIGYGNVMPRDLKSLSKSLSVLPTIKDCLKNFKSKKLVEIFNGIKDFSEVQTLLDNAIVDNPPAVLRDGGYICSAFNADLEELRNIKTNSQGYITKLEEKEREATGIKNLRIGFNSVFGYYIEVTKLNSELVPFRYIRKQTLTNTERYTTEELQEYENKVFSADEQAIKLEAKIYKKLTEYLVSFIGDLQEVSDIIASIDMLVSLAECAVKYRFVKPTISRNVNAIKIKDGRHPIVEKFAGSGNFIANDTILDNGENQMMVITGPNMAGKSTYMRQVALIVFMAHIGSFVPASSAEIAITDRIFTRVGASDDLAFGQSTFMVEMSEVATILANATSKSLVVLDEIGRGTSTFDGLSIAWAVVEYIAKNLGCKTLFATHYHELSNLEGVIDGVKNYKVTLKEVGDKIVFLRKIVRGHASRSFGIEVASLAGVPSAVIDRAKEISVNLEKNNQKLDLDIFSEDNERLQAEKNTQKALAILAELKDIDMTRVSPMESFEILANLTNNAKE